MYYSLCICIQQHSGLQLAVVASVYSLLAYHLTATFNVSLELQGGNCLDHLSLICRHDDALTAPLWIHNRTVETGETIGTAFPGAMYIVQTRTQHTTNITGITNLRDLDGHLIHCAYDRLGNLTKSNAVKYSFLPPGQS